MKNLSPDQEFGNPRLAVLYDKQSGGRSDLAPYISIVEELEPSSVLDLGCGTGTLLRKLTSRGIDLVGVDPAEASLNLAIQKTRDTPVKYVLGGSESIPPGPFDIAFMTGNVAQVFLSDGDWEATLNNIHAALSEQGVLVFETRNPDARKWQQWNRKDTYRSKVLDDIGRVDSWCEVTDVSLPYVSFKWTYIFESDGAVLTSDSTLIFREKSEIEDSLSSANFDLVDIRDSTDQSGEEFIFIARKA